jgi:lysophospholipase L1-like esterase
MKILNRFALILLGIIAGIAFIEGMLHFKKAYSFDAMVSTCKFCSSGERSIFRNSNTLGYEFVPNSSKEINSFGMHDKEYMLIKPKGAYRILLLGDSITELGKWSEYLEDRLNKDGKYEILNCAVRGWDLYNYYAYMKYKAMQFDPDLILIGFCLNDVTGSNFVFQIKDTDTTGSEVSVFTIDPGVKNRLFALKMNSYLFQTSYLYRFYLANFVLNTGKYSQISDPAEELEFIKKQAGGKVLGIIFPYLKPLDTYNDNEKREYREIREALNKTSIKYVDLTSLFNSYGKDIVKFRFSPNDKIHFNEDANRLKSEVIYKWLSKEIQNMQSRKTDLISAVQ